MTVRNANGAHNVAAVIVVVIALAVIGYISFDWNLLKGAVSNRIAAASGRTFSINGNLNVHLSLRPRITMDDVALGNLNGGSSVEMLTVRRIEFSIDLPHLLVGRLILPDVNLTDPHLLLETIGARNNWNFGEKKQSEQSFPNISALTITAGILRYRDLAQGTDLVVHLQTRSDASNNASQMTLTGEGNFKGLAANIKASGGAVLSLRNTNAIYPMAVSATIGSTKVVARGILLDPLHFRGENIDFSLEGQDLADLFPIVGVPLPPTPKYRLSGHLTHKGTVWRLNPFHGIVGSSDLAGDFSVDRGTVPQSIHTVLTSENINLQDLGGFIGAKRGNRTSPVPPSIGKVLPREPFDLTKLNSANAEVHFLGKRVVTERLPFDNIEAMLSLKDGMLHLHPLKVGVAGGSLLSDITMDARKPVITSKIDIKVKNLHLDQIFPASKLTVANVGVIDGRAAFGAPGNSIATILGSANGRAALIIDGGSISELALKLSNLDLANSLGLLVMRDKQVPLLCMVADFDARDGDFVATRWVLDTTKAMVAVRGEVNLKNETLDLSLHTNPKTFSLAAFRGPIVINGTLSKPSFHATFKHAIPRAALAVALGIPTAGLGAFIPLVEFGIDKKSSCAELMDKSNSSVSQH